MRISRARFWLPILVLALAGVADAATTLQGTIKCAAAQCSAADLSDGNTGSGPLVHQNAPTFGTAPAFGAGGYTIAGSTSGTVLVKSQAAAIGTVTLPNGTDTLVGRATPDTLTNKTLTDVVNQEHEISTAATSWTSSTTLAVVTGLSQALAAGGSYECSGHLTVTASGSSGGIQVLFVGSGGLTATSATFTAANYNGPIINARTTALGLNTGAIGAATAAVTDVYIVGSIVVNAAGTINLEAAQNAASAITTTVGQGSTFACVRVS